MIIYYIIMLNDFRSRVLYQSDINSGGRDKYKYYTKHLPRCTGLDRKCPLSFSNRSRWKPPIRRVLNRMASDRTAAVSPVLFSDSTWLGST